MIAITGEMRQLIDAALADRVPCFLGTASKDGLPLISMRGSVMVYDGETLAYWERSKRGSLENVSQNPHVVVFYRDPENRINWRFHGTASVHETGPIREEVMSRTVQAELDRDPDGRGVAVLVRVDKITTLLGEVLQQRDDGPETA